LAGTAFIVLYSIWLLLLAYRVVGKPRGQDPKYDASIEYWSGSFKVIGILGIFVLVLEVLTLLVESL
jgi:hypothetical protein